MATWLSVDCWACKGTPSAKPSWSKICIINKFFTRREKEVKNIYVNALLWKWVHTIYYTLEIISFMKSFQGLNKRTGCLCKATINRITQNTFLWLIFSGEPAMQLSTLEEISVLERRSTSPRELRFVLRNMFFETANVATFSAPITNHSFASLAQDCDIMSLVTSAFYCSLSKEKKQSTFSP